MKFFEAIKHFFETVLLPSWMAPEWMPPVEQIGFYITTVIGLLFTIFYTYQFFYVFLAFVKKPRKYPDAPMDKRYAAIIAARNEEIVLPELIKSIKAQGYPEELIDIYVVADNCTDSTAAVARDLGANVFERHNKEQVGKGYALEFLFDRIKEKTGSLRAYDAYLVFDADNVLRPNYFEEMNKAYQAGYRVITSYRNSKNYGKTWVSAGYALWFLRESRHLQNARSILGSSAAISGTGFLVDSEIIDKKGGWKYFLLTEDIQLTADCITEGIRIGYCHEAEFFDEQPETFKQSWRQRKRWAKGMFQVIRRYGGGLLKGACKFSWSCYDMAVNIMPAFMLSTIQLLSVTALFFVDLIMQIVRAVQNPSISVIPSKVLLGFMANFLLYGYCVFLLLGICALISEWRKIHCNKWRAIWLLLWFPVFMLSYIPISLVAFFSRRVEWKSIAHKRAMSAAEIEAVGAKREEPPKTQ